MSFFKEADDNGLVEESIRWERRMSSCLIIPPRYNIRLPEEIMLNILSRLPVESVLECRLVCKTWRNLPLLHGNNTYFTDMHLRCHPPPSQQQQWQKFQHDYEYHHNNSNNSDTKLSFVFFGTYPYKYLYYVEINYENDAQSYITHKRITLPLPADTVSLVIGSCNGLICLSVIERNCLTYDPVFICNPITREFVHLPKNIMDNEHKYTTISEWFGYHPSTNEYKVVRVYYCIDQGIELVYVYTLGSGIGWRYKGELTHTLQPGIASHAVLLNGALHWLSIAGNIVAFDLADEKFRSLPTPPFSLTDPYYRCKIWMLDRWLCIVRQKNSDAEIWLLKKKNEDKRATSSNHEDIEEKEYQSRSWSREFTITLNKIYDPMIQPLAITKSGEILALYKGKSIVSCDPKSFGKLKKLGDLCKAIIVSYAISHFNSFVSLKALGENAEIL